MNRAIALMLCLCAATPAFALSCLRPDAVALLQMAQKSEEVYVIVRGTVTLSERANLPTRNTEEIARTKARVTGEALNGSGFTVPFDREITIEASCLGPWCGTPLDIERSFLALKVASDKSLTLRVGPCGGDIVTWDVSGEARLKACFLHDDCRQKDQF